jgi:hypothetical protein
MRLGALTILAPWNALLATKVLWQPTLPRNRFRRPRGTKLVLARPLAGQEARLAHRCPTCATIVLPPDEVYDETAD